MKNAVRSSKKDLQQEIASLRARLDETEQALEAIRHGEIDAIVVNNEAGEQVYILQGADHSYRVLVETMNEGTATLSEEGLVLYANARLASLLRMKLEALQGANFLYFINADQRRTFSQLLKQSRNGPVRTEILLGCLDGSLVPVLLSMSGIPNQELACICLVVTDLSEQKRTEAFLKERTEELASANEELETANEELEMTEEELRTQNEELEKTLATEKSLRQQLIQTEKFAALARLVASVAHEINNPLQTVQNSLYLLERDVPSGDPENILMMAVAESKRMGVLVQQLQETYRPSSSRMVDFELTTIMNKLVILLAPHLKQNNIVWKFNDPIDGIRIYGVPDQIQQVFLNICLNAIDAMGSEGGLLQVGVAVPDGKEKVCVAFRDTGSGIKAVHLSQIFEPFFTTKPKGTGLGLAVCYEIVKEHSGEIRVESEPGKGATFKVWLPVRKEGNQ